MSGIGVKAGELAILDDGDGAAARDTEAAISMNAVRLNAIGRHARFHPLSACWIPHLSRLS
jgi:hypothetical protein